MRPKRTLNRERGELLRQKRKELQLSQQEIADQFGVSKTSISFYENGNALSETVLSQYAELFSLSYDEILTGTLNQNTSGLSHKPTSSQISNTNTDSSSMTPENQEMLSKLLKSQETTIESLQEQNRMLKEKLQNYEQEPEEAKKGVA